MNSIFAKRIRSTIESAKQDLDLARQQRTTSATLRQCNIVNAIQVTKAFVEAVDSGVRLPGEIVASVVFSRPMSDIDAINWWLVLAEELRRAFPNRIKGSSGKLDYPRYLKNERGEQMGRDGKPLKTVKTKHKGPDGKTYLGEWRSSEPATDRDNMDEAMLLEVERRKAEDWSNLFRLLSEAVDEHEPNKRQAKTLAGGDENLWITGADAERLIDVPRGTIKRAADRGEIAMNGKPGRGKKYHLASIHQWHKRRANQDG